MSQEFCSHLNNYGQLYRRVSEAYETCLSLMDDILAGSRDASLVTQLESGLNNWEKQARVLRSTFANLKDKGHVLLPRDGQNPEPVCGHCGFEVPRLTFAEFEFREDGTVHFRGQELELPVPLSA